MKLSSTAKHALIATGVTALVTSLIVNGYLLVNQPSGMTTNNITLSVSENPTQGNWPKPSVPNTEITNTYSTMTYEVLDLDFAWQNPTALDATSTLFLYRLDKYSNNYNYLSATVFKHATITNGPYKNWQLVTADTGEPGMGGRDLMTYLLPPSTSPYQMAFSVSFVKDLSPVSVRVNNNVELPEIMPLYVKAPVDTATLPNGKVITTIKDGQYALVNWTGYGFMFTSKYKQLKSKEGYTIEVDRHGDYTVILPGGRSIYYSEPSLSTAAEGSVDIFGLKNAGVKTDFNFQLGGLDTANSGCGGATSVVYVDEVAPKDTDPAIVFKSSDLELLKNTSTTRPIYRVKNLQHPSYKKAYELWYQPEWDNQEKPSFETFMTQHDLPFFLTKDSMGTWTSYTVNGVGVVAECGKPVIYLYPTQATPVHVQLPATIDVTVSEPTYPKRGWDTVAEPSGKLTMPDGSTYTSLFWEGYGATYKTPMTGYIVKGSEVESFLNKTLTQYGLNNQEAKEFMDFWVPLMKPYNTMRVSFVTDEWSKNVPLNVTPKPDTSIRLFMDWSPVSVDATIGAPKVTTPERKGFTLVEWGGLLRK